jgi:hypothetical protein
LCALVKLYPETSDVGLFGGNRLIHVLYNERLLSV